MRILFSIIFVLFLSFPAPFFAATDPWVVMARVARGEEGGAVVVDTTSVFSLAKSILATVATGGDAADLVKTFLETFVRDGQIGNPEYVHDDFWGVLALRAGGVPMDHPALPGAKATILRAEHARGGWSWNASPDIPDTDDTAAAIMALLELGMTAADPAFGRAFAYLRAAQNADGGFPNVPPGLSSVDSTAWVAMALQKAGEDASRARTFLQSKVRDDGSWGSPATTSFAAIALSGKWFPVMSITARGPAPLHPAPTASVLDLLGLERGPRNVSPLAVTLPLPSDASLPTGRQALSSPGERAAGSAILPIGFVFPSVVATSVFSKQEKVAVVHAAVPPSLIKKKEVAVKKVMKKKNVQKKKHR